LKVHVSYGPLVQQLLKKFDPPGKRTTRVIKGLAHITGGGFVDNIPRVLPKNCDAIIRKGSWEMLPIFELIRAHGNVPERELYQVFNMGIGMTLIVPQGKADDVLRFIKSRGQQAWIIGEVKTGNGAARVL
jgi:phosphoribosylformylglycinamidine cyclo-ligase